MKRLSFLVLIASPVVAVSCSLPDLPVPADGGDAETSSDTGADAGANEGGKDSASSEGGSDSGPDATIEAGGDAPEDTGGDAGAGDSGGPVTFAEVWTDVIDVHCVGCHSPPVGDAGAKGGFAIGQLDMSTAEAGYANLVNVSAKGTESLVDGGVACDTLAEAGVAGGIRVVPGDAGASLLYLKVNGFTTPPPCSLPMPANGEIPDGGQAAVVQEIQTWIDEGAHP